MNKPLYVESTEEASLRRRFRIAESELDIAGRPFSILHPANSEDLIDEEDFERDERLPYWADIWPSSVVLATHLLANPALAKRLAGRRPRVRTSTGQAPRGRELAAVEARGRTALELGCGCGLVAAAAAAAGFEVTATDYYEEALAFTRVNVFRTTGTTPRTGLLDWRSMPADLGSYDLVLASDVLYEREYAGLVAEAISVSLAPAGTAIVADPGRFARPAFVEAVESMGMQVAHLGERPIGSGSATQRIAILSIRRCRVDGEFRQPTAT